MQLDVCKSCPSKVDHPSRKAGNASSSWTRARLFADAALPPPDVDVGVSCMQKVQLSSNVFHLGSENEEVKCSAAKLKHPRWLNMASQNHPLNFVEPSCTEKRVTLSISHFRRRDSEILSTLQSTIAAHLSTTMHPIIASDGRTRMCLQKKFALL